MMARWTMVFAVAVLASSALVRAEPGDALPRLDALWGDLLADDATRAYQAVLALRAVPEQAVTLFQERLRPAAPVDPQKIARWVSDLDSNAFAVREKAAEELGNIGSPAGPALRRVLAAKPSLEVRQRVESLLERLAAQPLIGEELRAWRALEVLEAIGTPAARQTLQTLAQGEPGARVTEEARRLLDQLARRPATAPGG